MRRPSPSHVPPAVGSATRCCDSRADFTCLSRRRSFLQLAPLRVFFFSSLHILRCAHPASISRPSVDGQSITHRHAPLPLPPPPLPTLHVLDTRTAAHATSHRTTAGGKSQLKTNEAAKSIKCKVRSLGCSPPPPPPDLPANLPLHREPCRPEAALGQQAPQAQVRGLLRHPCAEPVTAAAHAPHQ